jgi:hypothetical protein
MLQRVMTETLQRHRPSWVVLFAGGNDALPFQGQQIWLQADDLRTVRDVIRTTAGAADTVVDLADAGRPRSGSASACCRTRR